MAYVGQTKSRALIARLARYGIGEMTVRSEVPPKRHPWAFDNGAYLDWREKKPFNETAYLRALERADEVPTSPDFYVVPDIVAGGMESLRFSQRWVGRLASRRPKYLAVQDGMSLPAVRSALPAFDGLFVGGTLPWKLGTAGAWITVAHAANLPCHIGRVGTASRVLWARQLGADSIDSALPLWSEENLQRFMAALWVEA